MARTAHTEDKKQAFLEALQMCDGVISEACKATDIPRRTVYNWIKDDEEFKAAVDSTDEVVIDMVENELFKRIKEGNVAATIFFLKTRGRSRGYIERQELDVRAANVEDIPWEIVPIKKQA